MSDNEIYIQRKIKLFKYLSEFMQKPISIFETVEIAKMIKNKYDSPQKYCLRNLEKTCQIPFMVLKIKIISLAIILRFSAAW